MLYFAESGTRQCPINSTRQRSRHSTKSWILVVNEVVHHFITHHFPIWLVLTPFWSAKHSTRTVAVPSAQGRTVRAQGPDGPRPGARRGGALCTGTDGPRAGPDSPRPGAGTRVSCLTAGRSAPWGRTVRACIGAAEGRRRRLDLAPGRDPVGEERS
jgi:hypothetical protein